MMVGGRRNGHYILIKSEVWTESYGLFEPMGGGD